MKKCTKQHVLSKTFSRAYVFFSRSFCCLAITFLILSFGFVQPSFVSANAGLTEIRLEELMDMPVLSTWFGYFLRFLTTF